MILCVDPDEGARTEARAALDDAGFDTVGRGSAEAAEAVLASDDDVEAVVTEADLPDATGLELVQTVRERAPDAACVLFTATPLADLDTAAFGDLVAEYISKDAPDAHEELVAYLEHAVAFQSQTAYPLPDHEDARVAALEEYATDPAALGDSLDRLTIFATELLDRNAAGIGLIDAHSQEFLSCHGISLDTIDREETVCTYALLEDGVTVVEDTQADPRFAGNEKLVAGNIRFYASAPLVTPDGRAIGTFCVYDDEPGTLSDRERELLEMLAAEAMDQLDLRRRLRETAQAPGAGGTVE